MAIEKTALTRSEKELCFVRRQTDVRYFEWPRSQLSWFTTVDRNRIKMRPAVAFRLEVNVSIVRQPPKRVRARSINPGVIVNICDHPGFAGGRIQQHYPAILVVCGARHQDCVLAVFGPLKLCELNITILWRLS